MIFKKLTAIILMPTKFKFENVYYSFGNNESFYKNDENSLRFKGTSRESLDENHEKEATTTSNQDLAPVVSLPDSHSKLLKCAQVPSENVRTWSTWLNNNYF